MCRAALACLVLWAAAAAAAAAADDAAPVRLEARSANYFVVAMVRGDSMSVHLSRLLDNAAVRDASIVANVRGASYPATAQADGGYAITAKELSLPGAAAIDLLVGRGGEREKLTLTLNNGQAKGRDEDRNSIRQIGWWILNFSVCIGFLMLVARRRKAATG